jgi:hypothetical protein
MQRSRLGRFSVWLNSLFGGAPDETLCARWASSWHSDCLPCRLVGLALRDPDHCADELRRWLSR